MQNLIYSFFSWYITYIIKKDFSRFVWNNVETNHKQAILLIANHFSWWDGFLMFHLNKTLFKRKFHVMVTDENYKNVFFLRFLGAFPVKKRSKEMLVSLKNAGELLNDNNNLLLIFPQGKLYSDKVSEIVFEKGLIRLINYSQKNFQYLFAATFVDYFDKRKPGATCYLESWEDTCNSGLNEIAGAYNTHYRTSREKQSRITV